MRLMKPPSEINLGAVVRQTETDFHLVECFDPLVNRCRLSDNCRLKGALGAAINAYLAVLDGVRDESSKDAPVRLVFEPKSRTIGQDELINTLLAHTSLETSAPINLTMVGLDGKPVDLSGGARRWLQAGRHAVLLSGPDVAPDLRLTPLPTELLPATMLPVEYASPAGALVVEAEKPASEGQVKGQVMEKVGASGKLAHCVWDTEGQWATWQCTVPREGDYRLLIRGCSEQLEVLRSLQVDQALYDLRLSGTGGWSRTTSDWRYFALPTKLHLKPGAHTLRLEALSGSMNLDCFVLESQ